MQIVYMKKIMNYSYEEYDETSEARVCVTSQARDELS